jgi:hypothetical protein
MGTREEACYVNEETKRTLQEHASALSKFGIELAEVNTLQKDFSGALAGVGLVLQIVESVHPGSTRALVFFLRDLAIPDEEILRLRLDEPEEVLTYCRQGKEVEKP